MRSYLPIIASLFLVSTPLNPVVALEKTIVAQDIQPYIKDNIAREITVRINSTDNSGSGVIIAKQDNTYLILTNAHVLRDDDTFTVQTHDGIIHQAKLVENGIETDDDLALLTLSSDKVYQPASINSAATPTVRHSVLAVGYSTETGSLVTQKGTIKRVPDRTLKDGYQIGYSSNIIQGMSGGAILNVDGEVIGINGKSAFPIVNTGYVYQDGTKPSPEEIENYRQLSWGIPLNNFLVQVNPDILIAYNLTPPETVSKIETSKLTGWLKDLEAKAKQFTVRIDSSSNNNGSGVIIAKEGNNYTVLTSAHVVCEKVNGTQPCREHTYEVEAPDGNSYPVKTEAIKKEEGVDLAVVKFRSNKLYQVAELANYYPGGRDRVFAAGFPKLGKKEYPQWRFSPGIAIEKERGLLQFAHSLKTDSLNSGNVRGSVAGGYELVYTSITHGGMSGGAILDTDGRVVGIHGLVEGTTAYDQQNSSQSIVQLGLSLGISSKTFLGIAKRLNVNIQQLQIEESQPTELSQEQENSFQDAVLSIGIPQGNAKAEQWLERGNQLWRLERDVEAEQAFDRAIELNPPFVHLAWYGKGLALGGQDKKEESLAALQQANIIQPDFYQALFYQSSLLLESYQLDKALVIIEKAISLQKNKPIFYSQKGLILMELKQYSKAESAFNKAIELNPNSSLYTNRGFLFSKQKKWKLALSDFNYAIQLNPNSFAAYANKGSLYKERGQSDLAEQNYNKALNIESNSAVTYNNRGIFYTEQKKWDLAEADFNQALDIDPDSAQFYTNRGWLYTEQEKWNLAENDYNKALEIDSKYVLAYVNRGINFRKQQNFDLAEANYNRAIEINPRFVLAFQSRGFLYKKQQKFGLAIKNYTKAIEIDPEDIWSYKERGNILRDTGKLELALADYNKALEIDDRDRDVYINRGVLYSIQEQLELALADFNKAIEIDPKLALTYWNRGLIYQKHKKIKLALADFNRAINIDNNYAHAYSARGILYREQKEYELALYDLNKAIHLDSKDVVSYINLGLIFREQNKYELALSNFDKAIELDFQNYTAYFIRGLLYQEQEKWNLAEADFDRAVQLNPSSAEAYTNRGISRLNLGNEASAISDLKQAEQLFTTQNDRVAAQEVGNILKQLQ